MTVVRSSGKSIEVTLSVGGRNVHGPILRFRPRNVESKPQPRFSDPRDRNLRQRLDPEDMSAVMYSVGTVVSPPVQLPVASPVSRGAEMLAGGAEDQHPAGPRGPTLPARSHLDSVGISLDPLRQQRGPRPNAAEWAMVPSACTS